MGTTLRVGDPSAGAEALLDELTVWQKGIDFGAAIAGDSPPPAPRDVRAQTVGPHSARISWSSPLEEHLRCVLRYYTEPITAENWAEAELIRAAPQWVPEAARWVVDAKRLPNVKRIWFAVRRISRYYLESSMSNVVCVSMEGRD